MPKMIIASRLQDGLVAFMDAAGDWVVSIDSGLLIEDDTEAERLLAVAGEHVADSGPRRLEGKLTEDQFKPLRSAERPLPAAARLHAARAGALWHAVGRADAHAGRHRRQVRSRLRPLHHPPEHPVQLDQAGGCADILADLATVEMHAIQTSGNCIRNISSDHYAGAAADELVDPRPYAELLRQWSSFHPEFLYLPRKFKIAVIGSDDRPRGHALHDIGIRMQNADGEIGLRSMSAAAWAAPR
jgi:sulfite reductase (NADPH) hemoprotein beta-component